jgi:carboxymethylenebutenolidase
MTVTIDYYLSTSSPWTYLGARRLMRIAEQTKATVNVYPVGFGQIFAVSGGLPLPKRAPQRQAYRMMELKRWKEYLNDPINIEPTNFPATAPISSHAIIAARELGLDALGLSTALLTALWVDDRNIDDAEVTAAVVAEHGIDADAVMTKAGTPEIAALFESDTQHAIDQGVFGAPSYVVDGEIFWGQDRVDLLAWRLGVA